MDHETPLFQAVLENNLIEVNKIIKTFPDQIGIPCGERRDTPLHVAAFDGLEEIADVLVKNGADVNARNGIGDKPLHCAAWQGYPEIAEILLRNHATMDCKNNDGWTPLYLARKCTNGCRRVADILIQHGVYIDLNSALHLQMFDYVRDHLHTNPRAVQDSLFPSKLLIHAVDQMSQEERIAEIAALLLDHGADVNGVYSKNSNETALLIACKNRDMPIEVFEVLLNNGADTTLESSCYNLLADDLAENFKNHKAAALIRKHMNKKSE